MPGEKTEAPTPKRVRDARKRGQVSKSQEIVSIGVLLTAIVGLRLLGPGIGHSMEGMLRDSLVNPTSEDLTAKAANDMGRDWAQRAGLTLAPLMGLLMVAGVALNVGQTGFILSGEKLKPKMSHVNPAQGFKRIFATEGLINLAKALLKMGIVAAAVTMVMRKRMAEITTLGNVSIGVAIGRLVSIAFDIAIWSAVVLFVLTVADYAWQRRKHFKELQMTKDEVRQEMKETEGDPQIKGAIRRRRQALLNRMIAAVPKADVMVTNPTHFAVALRYDRWPGARRVWSRKASGFGPADQGSGADVRRPVLEEPPLARALYAAVPVGHPIPANLFHAVAEVLAWVYSLRTGRPQEWRGSGQPQGPSEMAVQTTRTTARHRISRQLLNQPDILLAIGIMVIVGMMIMPCRRRSSTCC